MRSWKNDQICQHSIVNLNCLDCCFRMLFKSINPITTSDFKTNFSPTIENEKDSETSNHVQLCAGIINFDLENLKANVDINRSNNIHMNVTSLLPQLGISINSFDPVTGIVDVDATISNPYAIDAYDIRLIIYTDNIGHMLKNPDDWTDLYDNPQGWIINPFKAYAKDQPNRIFSGPVQYTENLQIYLPGGNPSVTYAIDASYPSNCEEPYSIDSFSHDILYDTPGAEANSSVCVYDWMDDINSVFLYCPAITGVDLVAFAHDSGDVWNITLTNNTGAAQGQYMGVILANSGGLTLYDVVAITVTHSIPHSGWAQTWGGSQTDQGLSVTFDLAGYSYVTGCFKGPVDFDPGDGEDEHTGGGCFLSKFALNGDYEWGRSWEESATLQGTGWSVDSDGQDIYICGAFYNTVDFDPGSGEFERTSAGANDNFLIKYDAEGNFLWAQTWGGTSMEEALGVAADNSGNIYVTGYFYYIADFDPGPEKDEYTSVGEQDIYMCKYDSDGNYLWTRQWGGTAKDIGKCVAVDNSGYIFAGGHFLSRNIDLDPGSGTDIHDFGAYLCKYDPDGNYLWGKTWQKEVHAVTADALGNSYVTGIFHGTVDFDPDSGVEQRTSHGGDDVFLSKFDLDGIFQWVRTWGGTGNEDGLGVSADISENIYTTGWFYGLADLDPTDGVDQHDAGSATGMFISKINASGDFTWARSITSTNNVKGMGVDTDYAGNSAVTGWYWATTDFDPGTGIDEHDNNGWMDIFVTKLLPNGYWQ